jgi:hypothetical protein
MMLWRQFWIGEVSRMMNRHHQSRTTETWIGPAREILCAHMCMALNIWCGVANIIVLYCPFERHSHHLMVKRRVRVGKGREMFGGDRTFMKAKFF